MKKIILIIVVLYLLIGCNGADTKDILYKQYEEELMRGNIGEAENILDKIIAIDNSSNYLMLKISLLFNRCKKEEALKLINRVLETDNENIELLMLKIILVTEKRNENELMNYVELLLINKINSVNVNRHLYLKNLVVLRKIRKMSDYEIEKSFESNLLEEEDELLLKGFIDSITLEEIQQILKC